MFFIRKILHAQHRQREERGEERFQKFSDSSQPHQDPTDQDRFARRLRRGERMATSRRMVRSNRFLEGLLYERALFGRSLIEIGERTTGG